MGTKISIGTLVLTLALAAGCGGGGGSSPVVRQACERGDECDLLDGQSVGDCTSEGNDIYDGLTDEQKDAFEAQIQLCLDEASCADFDACLNG